MQLYKVTPGAVVHHQEEYFLLDEDWNYILRHDNLYNYILSAIEPLSSDDGLEGLIAHQLLAPIGNQEVWAAGVTWLRSKEARMDESKTSGAAVFYDMVYDAPRPELFFKATASRVAGHRANVHIRKDSAWNVPEPELTLFLNSKGSIQAYTIGNDVSSRSIEGENPLYLPQAKTYQWSAALGPCLLIQENPISPETLISMEIVRRAATVYRDSVRINKMKRSHEELATYLFLECDFPDGCFLMTGTCLVPAGAFTLEVGDEVNISIEGIGVLSNTVVIK